MNFRTTHTRTPAVALAIAAACAAALPAHAAEQASSRQEAIGMTSGLTIGALAGGPFGAIFGAAAGALLGDRYHRQKVETAALAADLAQSSLERGKLDATLVELQSHSDQLAKLLERRSNLETQVLFRTGESALTASAFEQLKKLGALASTMPDLQVHVSGYADPRGTEELNSALSRKRAEAVAAVLAGEGIDASRLVVEAHGESAAGAARGDLDGYAFERRVVVRIEPSQEALARRN